MTASNSLESILGCSYLHLTFTVMPQSRPRSLARFAFIFIVLVVFVASLSDMTLPFKLFWIRTSDLPRSIRTDAFFFYVNMKHEIRVALMTLAI